MRKYLAVVAILAFAASAGATELTLRVGQGGFRDDRAPDGELGGGQVFLDVTFSDLPVTLSVGQEYYTKSPDPTQSYEISSIVMGTVCYVIPLAEEWPTDLYPHKGLLEAWGLCRGQVHPQQRRADRLQRARSPGRHILQSPLVAGLFTLPAPF